MSNDSIDKYGNAKWTKDQLKNALNKAIKIGGVSVTAYELLKKHKKFTVYLGKYQDSINYVTVASNNNGVAFSMDPNLWNQYEKVLKFNMWVLNSAFLDFCIGLGCNFGLCSQPSLYYNYGTGVCRDDYFYAKELRHINAYRGFKWYSDIPIVYANR